MSLGLEELLAQEHQARRSGTGLTESDLVGCWQLQRFWPRGSRQQAALGGWLLRGLAARLEITAVASEHPDLRLSNAVNLGPVELRFRGPGRLQGRRPLLRFQFDQVELIVAGQVLLQRPLPVPAPGAWPFFALISREPEGWLSARGRGGGLAQWRLQPLAAEVGERLAPHRRTAPQAG